MLFTGRLLVILGVFSVSAAAQTQLVVREDEQLLTVYDFTEAEVIVEDSISGELRPTASRDFELIDSEDFDPTLITIGRSFDPSVMQTIERGIIPNFSYPSASSRKISSVILVVEFWNENERQIVVRSLGKVSSRFGLPITVDRKIETFGMEFPYLWRNRFFSEGKELLSTQMHWREVQKWMDPKIESKLHELPADTPAPVPWVTPMPVYPKSLIESREIGLVEILCRIDAVGFISEFEVKKASHPEFQKSAERFIKYFRFIPRMKDGEPVPTRVLLPFRFHPLPEK